MELWGPCRRPFCQAAFRASSAKMDSEAWVRKCGVNPTKLAVKDGESTQNDDGMGIPWGKPMEP